MFEMSDEELYEQIKNHPKVLTLHSKFPDQFGNQRDFQYFYVNQKKYMLGQGSFGRVFVCFHQSLDRIVKLALKIIKIPQAYQQIKSIQHIVSTSRQQIMALIKLRQNKHIIRIQDIKRQNNIIYIFLQFCNERDLVFFFGHLRKLGKIDKQLIIRYYFAQILDAFKELNKLNFMHRDIKPSNILVNNGVLKIADFGLARQIIQGQREMFEEHVGTMITAAPQIVFKQEYTSKCDIYSLGVILYWMIYQKYPFEKVPTREDFTKNNLLIPQKCSYFQVSPQMQKLIQQMLAYNESDRIDWVSLLQHELFDASSFQQIDKKIRSQYQNIQAMKNRQTYGRNFISHLQMDDSFLQTTIPTSYYKFLREIEGEQKFNLWLLQQRNSYKENGPFHAHKVIKDQYKNQYIRIRFYQILLIQLSNLQLQRMFKKNKVEVSLIRSLIIYSIQKYLIYMMTKIKDQLIFVIPPSIFKIKDLKQAEMQPLHQNFVETVIEKVRGIQFTNKYNQQQIEKLKQKCQQFKLNQDLQGLFDQINESNSVLYLQLIDILIIDMICYLKPEIIKLSTNLSQNSSGNTYIAKNSQLRNLILLCHRLFMFSMQDEVFPKGYQNHFPYNTFIQTEQFKLDRSMRTLGQNILEMLSKFQ